ncbi:unnamed protein product [Schistosoma haematobium]|nr:unnamed protein product [Schistosoma haematobium]CAH8532333.1 unnamed protein product [Schistosoma haematobium]
MSSVVCSHSGFISSDIPNECDKYVPNELNSSHIPDVIVSDIGYSHNQSKLSRILSWWYDESEEIAIFCKVIREPVYPNMKFAQTENSNRVQDYPNEYEADAYFPF